MKSDSQLLAMRFMEVILNGTWVANTNYKNELTDLDWEIAVSKVGSLNTISLLAQHVHYYINGINNVFRGGTLDIKDKYSFDFPVIQSQQEWDEFLAKFWNGAEVFAAFVDDIFDEDLSKVFTDEKYGTFRRNIECMIEHAYYHLGQIVLLKKLISEGGA